MGCGAGWYPARDPGGAPGNRRRGLCTGGSERVTNPLQVTNLPHNFRRIPVPGKTRQAVDNLQVWM
jgi:hypothetical protein